MLNNIATYHSGNISCRIPGHRGIEENEKACELARSKSIPRREFYGPIGETAD